MVVRKDSSVSHVPMPIVQPSTSAFERLWALRARVQQAAETMLSGNCYSDFFVEGSGPPWHEAFEDIIGGRTISLKPWTLDRMTLLNGIRQEDYGDFFVENTPGGPWHEAFDDVALPAGTRLRDNPMNLMRRTAGLAKVSVLQAYEMLRKRTGVP